MGKNKGRDTKQKSRIEKAFVVNTMKKGKTKTVSTNLKKLNLQSKAKTAKADEKFNSLKEVVIDSSKTAAKKQPKQVKKSVPSSPKEPVDMDTTTESFSKL
ncbi:uncharacterized protein LOC132736852 [Ruditapes philippinarum]|uniref:uncharacterized protein LOC132736852 n=1 Tax=Ruditapes philippinarum TaxID=129788 RepID=UPI00295BAB16|nr:uncharacterized protein LOC132736852 [Ruditapes philippinarum]